MRSTLDILCCSKIVFDHINVIRHIVFLTSISILLLYALLTVTNKINSHEVNTVTQQLINAMTATVST